MRFGPIKELIVQASIKPKNYNLAVDAHNLMVPVLKEVSFARTDFLEQAIEKFHTLIRKSRQFNDLLLYANQLFLALDRKDAQEMDLHYGVGCTTIANDNNETSTVDEQITLDKSNDDENCDEEEDEEESGNIKTKMDSEEWLKFRIVNKKRINFKIDYQDKHINLENLLYEVFIKYNKNLVIDRAIYGEGEIKCLRYEGWQDKQLPLIVATRDNDIYTLNYIRQKNMANLQIYVFPMQRNILHRIRYEAFSEILTLFLNVTWGNSFIAPLVNDNNFKNMMNIVKYMITNVTCMRTKHDNKNFNELIHEIHTLLAKELRYRPDTPADSENSEEICKNIQLLSYWCTLHRRYHEYQRALPTNEEYCTIDKSFKYHYLQPTITLRQFLQYLPKVCH